MGGTPPRLKFSEVIAFQPRPCLEPVSLQDAPLSQGQTKRPALSISDPHNVPEVFVTSVVHAALISGSSIAVTLGMRRMIQDTFSESQEAVYVVSRPVLTLSAAEELVGMLSEMLALARSQRLQDIAPGTATPQ